MSFIEKQIHGKHCYYYLVKNVRISSVKVKKIRIFLGRSIPKHEELQKYFLELEKRSLTNHKTKWISKELVEKLDDLSASISVFNRTPIEAISKNFLVRYTYNTNAIEGNRLTLRQTALIIIDKITPQGATTEDVMEALNAIDSWDFVKSFKGRLNKNFICKIQYEVTKHTSCRIQGAYRDNEVRIAGSEHIPPEPSEITKLLDELFNEFYSQRMTLHPVELATLLHNKFVNIHPFTDGNGRTARLLINWVLIKNKFPPVIIEVMNKEKYYTGIEAADKGNQKIFAMFLANELLTQYINYNGATTFQS